MNCAICVRIWQQIWDVSNTWERAQSNESHLWELETDDHKALIDRAVAIQSADPAAALKLYQQAADEGSIWAMDAAATCFSTGFGTDLDFALAQDYFSRAISAGSWMATLGYAKLLDGHGYHEQCDRMLEDGVALGFAPSAFWLGRLRFERSRTDEGYRSAWPMLEFASQRGHPLAKLTLARWSAAGKFGTTKIPRGLASLLACIFRLSRDADDPRSEAELHLRDKSLAGENS